MFIEDLNEVNLTLNIERLKCIRDLQKGILRRQSRFKRILSIYMKLHRMVNDTKDEFFIEDSFEEYHSLLQRIIANHLKDMDEMEQKLQHQASLETLKKEAIFRTRQELNTTQHKLSGLFRREDRIAKTLQAATAPNKAYVGFMENVLSGMRDPSEEINYEEYSTYCQVKWSLESVDMEHFGLTHALYDCQVESNELTDELLDHVDQCVLHSSTAPPTINKFSSESKESPLSNGEYKNLYNIYGFDGFAQIEEWDDEILLSDTSSVPDDQQTLEIGKNPEITSSPKDRTLKRNQSWSIQISNSRTSSFADTTRKEPIQDKADEAVEYIIDDIDFSEDHFMFDSGLDNENNNNNFLGIHDKDDDGSKERKKSSVDKRFSAYLRESTSTVTENDVEDVPVSELDFDLFLSSSATGDTISPLPSPTSPEDTIFENPNQGEGPPQQKQPIKRSSQVLTKLSKHNSLKRLSSSGSSTSSSSESTTANVAPSRRMTSNSSVSSTGSKDSKSGKRRINARRGKLIGNSDKDLFFLPPDDFDDDLFGNNNNNKNHFAKEEPSTPTTPTPSDTSQQIQDQNNNNKNSGSGHKKLQRLRNTFSVKKNNDTMTSSTKSKVTNIQNIVVDGKLLKVGDLTPYNVERLSIKNRPRKLSIIKHRNK